MWDGEGLSAAKFNPKRLEWNPPHRTSNFLDHAGSIKLYSRGSKEFLQPARQCFCPDKFLFSADHILEFHLRPLVAKQNGKMRL